MLATAAPVSRRAGDALSLKVVRKALEDALGVRFEGERGVAFFRSTLVQTLFYGVFSAWVLWARRSPPPKGRFNWYEAVWHLRAPVLRALFQQVSDPGRLQPLGLVKVLDWTAAALCRVDRAAFFSDAELAAVRKVVDDRETAATTSFGPYVIRYAREHLDDPRVSRALHRLVFATRHACYVGRAPGRISQAAYALLHEHFPDSEWAAKTPYWYGRVD